MGRPIYMDHNSTTPCDSEVLRVMWPYFAEAFGNAASRSHSYGREARDAVEQARGQVAAWIGGSPKEVVWTGGATEADNLALLGAVSARADEGRRHVVTVATEHPAVLDSVEALRRRGHPITVVPVGPDGRVDPDRFVSALQPDTAVASVMWVNSEIGVRHDLPTLGAACRERGIWLHVDAAQAAFDPVDVHGWSADLVSLSAHKIYGPKGIGALWVRRGRPRVHLEPLIYGGGHERGMRSGTLPVPLCVGMGAAAALVVRSAEDGAADRVRALRDALLEGLRPLGGVHVNGSMEHRAPHNLNVSFEGVEAQALLVATREHIAVSTGSACASASLKPSAVLRALGASDERAHGSIRFGLGRTTTESEVDVAATVVTEKVRELRSYSSLYEPV